MNDIERLIKRYLDGLTTTEEERRLHDLLSQDDAPEEWRALLPMLEKPAIEPPTDQWLTEDETAEYDRTVRRRRLKKAARILTAAAAVAATVIMTIDIKQSSHPQQLARIDTVYIFRETTTAMATKAEPSISIDSDKPLQNTVPVPTTKQPTDIQGEPITAPDTMPATAESTDSLEFYLARLEKELDRVGDSVYTAQLEKMIRTDSRLQEIINRKLFEKLLEHDNYITHNNQGQNPNTLQQ